MLLLGNFDVEKVNADALPNLPLTFNLFLTYIKKHL
jgi:hypothetical protein